MITLAAPILALAAFLVGFAWGRAHQGEAP